MPDRLRFVADTNVLISRLVFRNSVPAQAIRRATSAGDLLVSLETLEELESVLFRHKFDAYVTRGERLDFFRQLRFTANFIESVTPISACRDPRDDKFLALAVTGQAEFILSGDNDLLTLHPFRGIDILNPRQYLDRQIA
ncbi:MAG: putative toxin-antitoxin system toxin component, PIN family [Acidobacteriota bacterium]